MGNLIFIHITYFSLFVFSSKGDADEVLNLGLSFFLVDTIIALSKGQLTLANEIGMLAFVQCYP